MKKKISAALKILLSVALLPLWFAKIFRGVGLLPDRETGEIVEVVFGHSMLENICDGYSPMLAYLSMALLIASVLLNVAALIFQKSKMLQIIGGCVFLAAIGLFALLLLLASTVARGY